MNETLCALLAAFAPTYYDVLPVSLNYGITYTLFNAQDDAYESGQPSGVRLRYMVRVFQRAYDQTEIDAICATLRAAEWAIGARGPLIYLQDDKVYMYPIEITTWEDFDT